LKACQTDWPSLLVDAQYSLSFAPDSKSLATSSANSVVQLYDASSLAPTTMFNLSSASDATSSQQLGVTYLTPSTLASVSLSGVINLLDARAPDQTSYLYGPTKGITACGVSSAAESADSERTFWAGSFDGGVKSFVDGQDACWEDVRGEGHKGQIVGFAARKDGGVATTAWDDSVKEVTPSVGFMYIHTTSLSVSTLIWPSHLLCSCSSVPTPSQPSSIASLLSQDLVAVAAGESVDLLQAGKKIASKTFQGERVLSVALVEAASGPLLAVGFEANKVHVYAVSATSISEAPEVEFKESRNPVYALAFSPDGSLLAAGESGGKIQVFDVGAKSVKISGRWASHTGRITALRWSADGQHCASSSLDTNVFVWSVARPMRNIKIPVGPATLSCRVLPATDDAFLAPLRRLPERARRLGGRRRVAVDQPARLGRRGRLRQSLGGHLPRLEPEDDLLVAR
jgi:WD40 repeat protein